VVKWLLWFVQSHTFNGFAIYRVILGMVLLTALATHALPEGEEAKAKPEAAAKPVPALREAPIPVMDVSSPATMLPASAQTNTDSTAPATQTNAAPAAPATNAAP
jgi:hypothetical protein